MVAVWLMMRPWGGCLAILLIAQGCVKLPPSAVGFACEEGRCADGYLCNAQSNTCEILPDTSCNGGAVCPSDLGGGERCSTENTVIPCADDATTCDAGCRYCVEGRWSSCQDSAQACVPQPEVCDGLDNDCDGIADNAMDSCTEFWRDADGDGLGVTGDSLCLCAAAGVYVATVGGDCSDTSAACTIDCSSVDNDTIPDCEDGCFDSDGDGICATADCDDQDSSVNQRGSVPPQREGPSGPTCGDLIDNDCDGTIDAADDSCNWWDSAWAYRKLITVLASGVSGGPHNDFPLLVDLNDDVDLFANARADGHDIVFVDALTGLQLSHDIEEYDGNSDGDLVAWVKVQGVNDASDVLLYMYYGNSAQLSATTDSVGTFGDNYEAVYHLHDDFNDSTEHTRHGVNSGSSDTTGVIGDGQNFEADDDEDEIRLGNWNVTGQVITIQAWVRIESSHGDQRFLSKASPDGSSTQDHVWLLGTRSTLQGRARIKAGGTNDGDGTLTLEGGGMVATTARWYLWALTYDGSDVRVLIDGVQENSAAKTGDLWTNGWSISLGNHPLGGGAGPRPMDGKLDEVRVSSEVRSPARLRCEHDNVMNPGSFYSVGISEPQRL